MRSKLPSGAIEIIQSPEEKENNKRIKSLKKNLKSKKDKDLTSSEVRDLVYAIAKHLKIL